MDPAPDTPFAEPSAEFVGLLTGSQRKLYAFILSLVRIPADADDVLQETNLVLWRKCGDFTPGTSFAAWSFRVAQFQVMAYRKRKQRSKLHFDDKLVEMLASEAMEEEVGHDPRRHALAGCLKKLTGDQRRLVAQRYEPGGSVNAMAAEQGRSPKAVSEALRRIRRNLLLCVKRTLGAES